jgi:cellulose biosynthesis protein BcsQ
MAVVALYNLKGGVGKTTAAVNLVDLAARRGRRVLLWDLDAQGSSSFLLGVMPTHEASVPDLLSGGRDLRRHISGTNVPGVSMIAADASYRRLDLALDARKKPGRRLARLLEPVLDDFDDVVLDCPPSASVLGKAIAGAADVVLAPLIPSPLSVRAFDSLCHLVDEGPRRPNVRAFFSMVDSRRRLHRDLTDRLPGRWPGILSARIPVSADVERMSTFQAPLNVFAPGCKAAMAFEALYSEVHAELRDAPRVRAATA